MVSNIVVTSNIQTEKGRHKVFGRHFWGELEYAHYNLGLIIDLDVRLMPMVLEWIGREKQYAIESFALTWKRPFRYAFYYIIIITIYLMGGNEQQFIYFQF